MKVIDSHRHYWGNGWDPPSRIRGKAAVYSIPIAINEERYTRDPDGSLMIKEMETLGTDVGIIHTQDSGLGFYEPTATPISDINRFHCELAQKYPGKIYALFGIDPRRPGGVKLFEQAITEWGAKGLSFFPTMGFFPQENICYAYYQKCLDLGVPVTLHTGFQHHPMNLAKYTDPLHMDEVARDFPEVNFIMSHAGMDRFPSDHWWQTAICVADTKPNLYVDVANWQRDYPVSGDVNIFSDMNELFRKLRIMRDQLGAKRILFGTDMPSYNLEWEESDIRLTRRWVELFLNLPQEAKKYNVVFSQEETELILYGNAERIFKL